MAALLDRAFYAVGQAARVAWYASHHLAARRIGGPPTRPGSEPQFRITKERTGGRAFVRSMLDLFERDGANIEAGL